MAMPDRSQSGLEVQEQGVPQTARIRVLAFMEASTVTGPAKNLIEFARLSAIAGVHRPGVDFSVATFVRDPDRPNAFVDAVRHAGIPLHIIHESSPMDFRAVRQMKDLVRAWKPDIIQSHNFKAHFLVRFSGLHRKSRWIAFQHGYTWTDLKNRIYNQFDRWSLPAADRVVTVCKPFAEYLIGRGVSAERITVQHNSVKPFISSSREIMDSLRQELNIHSTDRVLLTVGRLSREKGHRDLLEALPLLKSDSGRLLLVIVGDGHERPDLQAQAQGLGIANRVIFAGHRADVSGFYGIADVVVLPSHSEGSPNVLLEAFSAGVPTVATRVGGIPEIAKDQISALIVEPNNPRSLAAGIQEVLDNSVLRNTLSSNAREMAARFRPEDYRDSVVRIYQQVLAIAK